MASRSASLPLPDQVRDYQRLITRWRKLAARMGLRMRPFARAANFSCYVVESRKWVAGQPSLYCSAGIHGDEPAAVGGLLLWAEKSLRAVRSWNLQIFPCLNPWGLVNNSRLDADGIDLNRTYQDAALPQVAAQLAVMGNHQYDLALTLHEDYEARGFYLYEVRGKRPFFGELLRDQVDGVLPPDPRKFIDGHPARNGVIRPQINPASLKGHPEAFRLHFHHARRTFTFETPSERDLGLRMRAQQRFIESSVKLLCVESLAKGPDQHRG